MRQYLLRHYIQRGLAGLGGGLQIVHRFPGHCGLQPAEILTWVKESVRMIDSQTIEFAGVYKVQHQTVRLLKNLQFFHPEACQFIDVKKAAVIYFICCNPPEGKPVWLIFQQIMEQVMALRFAGFTVEEKHVFLNKLFNIRMLPAESGEDSLVYLLVAVAYLALFCRYRIARRQVGKGGNKIQELEIATVLIA